MAAYLVPNHIILLKYWERVLLNVVMVIMSIKSIVKSAIKIVNCVRIIAHIVKDAGRCIILVLKIHV